MAARETKPNGKSQLIRDLKNGEFATLYIISGEESYMKEYYLRQLRQKVVDETFADFNLIEFEGKGLTPEMLTEAIDSYPAMTDKKLIHIKDSGIFQLKSGKDEASTEEKKEFWTEKFKRISDDTVVIFDETSVDKRSALYKAAAKVGTVVEFTYLSEADLVTWVVKQFLNAKKKISKENAYYLITICDSGLASINNEIKKLIDFCDEEIYKTDIDRVVAKSMEVIVFELTDAIMLGNTQKAMETLADLKTVKENVFTLIYLMLSTFEKMLRVKLMNGAPQAEIASEIGVSLFVARKYINSAKGFSEDSLVWMLRRVAEIDLAIKEGRVEEWNALEQYVAECIYRSHK